MDAKNEQEVQAHEKLMALSKTADAAMATYKEAEGNGTMNRSVVNRAVEALEALADALVTGPNAQRNFRSVLFTQTDASLKEVLAKRDEMDAREQKREEADKNLATLRDDADRAFATFSENQEKGTLTRAEAEEAFNALDMLFAELSSRGDGKQNSQSVLFKKTEEKQKEITQWLAQN